MDSQMKRDLRWKIIKSLIIIHIIVFISIITINCRIEPPNKINICEVPEREKIKLMPLSQHWMKVPIGTQIGNTITAHDGYWMSEQAIGRMAFMVMKAEKAKKEAGKK